MSAAAARTQVCHVTTAGGVAAGGVFASIRGIVDHLGRRDSLDVRLLYAAPAAAADAAEWSIPNVDHRRWSYRGPAFFLNHWWIIKTLIHHPPLILQTMIFLMQSIRK